MLPRATQKRGPKTRAGNKRRRRARRQAQRKVRKQKTSNKQAGKSEAQSGARTGKSLPMRMTSSRRSSEIAQKTGGVPRAHARANRFKGVEMSVPCHQAAVSSSVVREAALPEARAQSRWIASTSDWVATRTDRRASGARAPRPQAASHRTLQIAPRVATRRRVHCWRTQPSSPHPGHPADGMPSRMKSAVRGATSPVRASHVEISQSIAGAEEGQVMKA